MLRLILAMAACAHAAVDLVAPFTVDLISTKHPLWDTVLITTYLTNRGADPTTSHTFNATIMAVKIDSFVVGGSNHDIPAGYVLNGGSFVEVQDIAIAPKGPFAVATWTDPLRFMGEGGGEAVNNVRSAAYNFYPDVVFDTVVLYDTLIVRDTLRIRDTVKVTVRDTVIKTDTVKFCPPTMAKVSAAALRPAVPTTVYNAIGQPVWAGPLREGEYPPVRLRQGIHILVQGSRVHRFRVAYKE